MVRACGLGLVATLSLGCERPEANGGADAGAALRSLARASLDLRGVRPRDEEMALVLEDPSNLDGLLDGIILETRFPSRLVDLYNEVYLTRSEGLAMNPGPLGILEKYPFFQRVGSEPLYLLAQLAVEELPYTDIVTADWSMVDDVLASYYSTDYPEGATGWQKVHYTDGRPAAGVLTSNGMWWRYTSTQSSANRGRANAVSRILLCQDFMHRDVEIDPAVFLQDVDALTAAISEDPACANCHVGLDPLASNFFGFFLSNYTDGQEATTYHPSREPMWTASSGVAPGYFGTPIEGLSELGAVMVADSRLINCAVEQAWTLLHRREPTLADQGSLNAVREDFIDGGLTMRALFRSVVGEPTYLDMDGATDGTVDSKVVSVELLGDQVFDLTGFRWKQDHEDMLRTDETGLRMIAGGVDGVFQTSAPREPSIGLLLVQRALAELASGYAVSTEAAAEPEQRRLFREIDFTETAERDEAAIRAQLVALRLRVTSVSLDADDAQIDADLQLWTTLYAMEADPKAAWRGVLMALLRDPDLVLY